MSVNNWRFCPQCLSQAIKEYETAERTLTESYGKVSLGEFNIMRAQLGDPPPNKTMQLNLGEVWELGVSDTGKLSIYYGCTCRLCGFTFDFNHDEQLEINDDAG